MSVTCFSTPTFLCQCDRCGRIEHVEKDYDKIYNGAPDHRSGGAVKDRHNVPAGSGVQLNLLDTVN